MNDTLLNNKAINDVNHVVDFRGEKREIAIHDFIGGDHYASSFGKQWQQYSNVQIDRLNGTQRSAKHLQALMLGNFQSLQGKNCLEIGSGAGRFTDLLVDNCNRVITVDASKAIFANVALGAKNLTAIRADLWSIPIKPEQIDIVICRGVIQHTKDPGSAIRKLFDYVKPGGVVYFDVYHFKWFTPFMTKYWLRPITRRMDYESVVRWCESNVPKLLRIRKRYINPVFNGNKLLNNIGNQLIPIADYTQNGEDLTHQQQQLWSVLDTIDMYTPRYDIPLSWSKVMQNLEAVGAEQVIGDRSSFCFSGRRPA